MSKAEKGYYCHVCKIFIPEWMYFNLVHLDGRHRTCLSKVSKGFNEWIELKKNPENENYKTMSKELREQFSKETGLDNWEQPTNYFEWLESKLQQSDQQNKECCKDPEGFYLGMTCSQCGRPFRNELKKNH